MVCITGVSAVILHKSLDLSPVRSLGTSIERSNGQIQAKDFTLDLLAIADEIYQLNIINNPSTKTITSDDFESVAYILNFWASWCRTCYGESAILETLWNKYKSSDFAIIGVVVHDDPIKALDQAKILNKSYFIAYDKSGSLAINYGVSGVPESVFVKKDGSIVAKHVGALNAQTVETYLEKMQLNN